MLAHPDPVTHRFWIGEVSIGLAPFMSGTDLDPAPSANDPFNSAEPNERDCPAHDSNDQLHAIMMASIGIEREG